MDAPCGPAAAWQFDGDADTLAHFRRCVELYRAWGGYRRQLVAEAARTGRPIMRHLILHYPDDPVAPQLRYQYLLGSELLVAPVVDPGADTVSVYLPGGRWRHLWTGETRPNAGWQTVGAPIGQPAAFVRHGSRVEAPLRQKLAAAGILT